MLIKTLFFCGLNQAVLPATPKQGSKFANDFFLTKDVGTILQLISPFSASIGSLESNYLTDKAGGVIYRKSSIDIPSGKKEDIPSALADQLIKDLIAIKGFELALWMIKDNACHFDRGWIATTFDGSNIINNNTWAARPTCADGSSETVSFTFDELRIAREVRRPLGLYLSGSSAATALSKDILRFQRFEYFVGAARASVDVAVKIAQYCSALETLVSNSQQELSHQVSERVASVLIEPGQKRVDLYRIVKKAYGFRSKTVHGASFKASEIDQLRASATNIDRICRALQTLYFMTTKNRFRSAIDGSEELMNNYFLEAVLGNLQVSDALYFDVMQKET